MTTIVERYRQRNIVSVDMGDNIVFQVRRLSGPRAIQVFQDIGVADLTNRDEITQKLLEHPVETMTKVLGEILVEPRLAADDSDTENLSVYDITWQDFNKLVEASLGTVPDSFPQADAPNPRPTGQTLE